MSDRRVTAARIATGLAQQRPTTGLRQSDCGITGLNIGDISDNHDTPRGHNPRAICIWSGKQGEDFIKGLCSCHPETGVSGDRQPLIGV